MFEVFIIPHFICAYFQLHIIRSEVAEFNSLLLSIQLNFHRGSVDCTQRNFFACVLDHNKNIKMGLQWCAKFWFQTQPHFLTVVMLRLLNLATF